MYSKIDEGESTTNESRESLNFKYFAMSLEAKVRLLYSTPTAPMAENFSTFSLAVVMVKEVWVRDLIFLTIEKNDWVRSQKLSFSIEVEKESNGGTSPMTNSCKTKCSSQ